MDSLPDDIIREIQYYLPNESYRNLNLTAKHFNIPPTEAERLYRRYHTKYLESLAKEGDLIGVKYLFERGYDSYGEYDAEAYQDALSMACRESQLSVISYLVEHGVSVNGINIEYTHEWPLSCAAKSGYLEVIKYLIKRGATINTLDQYDHEEAIGLISACVYGQIDVVKYLIEQGANANAYYALSVACGCGGSYEIVKYLVEHGANIHANHEKPMISACENKRLKIIKYLITQGVDINYLADHRYLENWIVKYLVKNGIVERRW